MLSTHFYASHKPGIQNPSQEFPELFIPEHIYCPRHGEVESNFPVYSDVYGTSLSFWKAGPGE